MKQKIIYIFLAAILIVPMFTAPNASAADHEVAVKLVNYLGNKKSITLKVVKGEYKVVEDSTITLASGKTYYVKQVNGKLELYEGSSRLKTFSSSVNIEPVTYGVNNYVSINSREYLGNMEFTIESNYVRPINRLPLEDYLKGVVPYEMPASWDKEALKAQAVAARTYALARINQVINDTVTYQVYGGYIWSSSYYSKSNQAVSETSGMVLRYGGKLIQALYSSSNGGHTESNSAYWGTPQLPYLEAKPDSFDPQIPWSLAINKQQIDMSSLDLVNPEKWWSSVQEQTEDAAEIGNIKSYIKKSYPANTDIKVIGVPDIKVTEKSSYGKARRGTINVQYLVKNPDGSYHREEGSQLSEDYAEQLAGPSRYQTSVAVSEKGWENANSVVIGRGDISVDALAGSVLAKKLDSPLLLTESNEVPTSVLNEIKRLNASNVYLLGGQAAISDTVTRQLEDAGLTVSRVSGKSRYHTAVEVAQSINSPSEIVITSGDEKSPDALSIASYAARNQLPILLSKKDALSWDVKEYIKDNNISKAYIIGGTAAISDSVKEEIAQLGISNVERIAGSGRYATSVAIAERFNFDLSKTFFSRGDVFIDALPGASLAAKYNAPIILTEQDQLAGAAENWLTKLNTRPRIFYLGGDSAISPETRSEIKKLLLGNIEVQLLNKENVDISVLRFMMGGTLFKSFHIDNVTDSSGKLTIYGKGFGHAVGMSQYGAKERAEAGKTYQEILGFYYPNTNLGN
ncbi:SpoIID/LytB domain-containing protein [Bacillus marinisedimentorum]|uniref:SpoIID/LytB domain-containing protein n=1 Tax=Bacillus marinisedimentorum TaxID=1821260 RepID=UPI0007E1A321|nr:SpoIID/LytB domain-containing protein [Bacillus marinisedimentorum]